jgi:hypothetical protein
MKILFTALALAVLLTACGRGGMTYIFTDTEGRQYRGYINGTNDLPAEVTGKSGTLVEYFPNGRHFSETQYKDGLRHGTLKLWSRDGSLFGVEQFDRGIAVTVAVQQAVGANGEPAAASAAPPEDSP